MSGTDRGPGSGIGFTRARDLALVAVIGLLVGYLVTRWNYSRMPVLPRLAGVTAALLGLGEAIAGATIRARLRSVEPGRTALRPVQPLTAARALMVAKATGLAGAGIAGLWAGVLIHVAPAGGSVLAAGDDTVTAVIGLVGAAVMVAGGLWLEQCCRTPDGPGGPEHREN